MSNPTPIVAIVDDDPDEQRRLTRGLNECRHDLKIHLFTGPDDLLGYLAASGESGQTQPTPDLILLSLHLPGKSSFMLIREIKTNPDLRRIPLIVLDGSSTDPEIRQCYDLGANTVMTRPVLFTDLIEALKTLCDYWLGPVRV